MKRKLALGALIGAALAYFLRWRSGAPELGLPDAAPPADPEEPPQSREPLAGSPEDATLVDRVKSEVFRDERFKGAVNVSAEFGVVVLHGELESADLVEQLVARVREVEGVRDVDNRLHLPEVEVHLPKRPS